MCHKHSPKAKQLVALAIVLFSIVGQSAYAHYEEPDDKEEAQKSKTAKNFDPWHLLEYALQPAYAYANNCQISIEGDYRIIRSNGIPDHATGEFPNPGNPNTIAEQNYVFVVPTNPQLTGRTTPNPRNDFGVAVNGVPFDPGTAEFWRGDPSSGWVYEAMALGPRLGLDQNNAHVQPNGAYHYHGLPTGLIEVLGAQDRPVLLGYAADGFPIYGPFDYTDPKDNKSQIKKFTSSYRIKSGLRPTDAPEGTYNGMFVQDYEYVSGLGDLDDCNGRFGVTPEYPKGIYHYLITDSFPYIPRGYKGTPNHSFSKRPPGGFRQGPGMNFGPPGFGPPGGPGFGPPDGQGFGSP